MKRKIEIDGLPKAGPYSHAVLTTCQTLLFVSGQLPIDPKTSKVLNGPIQECVRLIISNIEALLQKSSMNIDNIVRVEIFLKNMDDFDLVNEEYALFFKGPVFPARQTIQAMRLPYDAPIEMSCIAAG